MNWFFKYNLKKKYCDIKLDLKSEYELIFQIYVFS